MLTGSGDPTTEQTMALVRAGFERFAAALRLDLTGVHGGGGSGAAVGAAAGSAAAAELLEDDPPFAVAWYRDGQTEVLRRRMFNLVTSPPEWLAQAAAVQSYVPRRRAVAGRYETTAHRVGARRVPLAVHTNRKGGGGSCGDVRAGAFDLFAWYVRMQGPSGGLVADGGLVAGAA